MHEDPFHHSRPQELASLLARVGESAESMCEEYRQQKTLCTHLEESMSQQQSQCFSMEEMKRQNDHELEQVSQSIASYRSIVNCALESFGKSAEAVNVRDFIDSQYVECCRKHEYLAQKSIEIQGQVAQEDNRRLQIGSDLANVNVRIRELRQKWQVCEQLSAVAKLDKLRNMFRSEW